MENGFFKTTILIGPHRPERKFTMFNMHINPIKAQAKKASKAQTKFSCNQTVKVAGINSILFFVQDSKNVIMPDGSKSILTIGRSNNPEFRAVNGDYFIMVGTKFMKMSHKEQVAHVYNICRQIRATPMIQTVMDECREICRRSSYQPSGAHLSYDAVMVEVKQDSAARRYMDLASMVGEKTARQVIMSSIKTSMHSSQLHAAAEAKVAKKTETTYSKKDWKDAAKTAKKETKESMKTAKADAKQETTDPLSEEAETIQDGAEPNAQPA